MANKKSIRVDFVKSCIAYNKLNKIVISGIENICKRLNLDSIYDVINGRFAIPSKRPSGKKSSSKRVVKCDTVFVAYRFCGHPTEEQASDLNQNIGASRFIWNRMLSDYKLMWKMYGISIPMTPADYKDVSGLEWLNDRDSLALANVQLNLEKARSDYFAGERGAPKRKKKHQCKDSYTTNRVGKNIRIEDGGLRLPKINGLIELSMHRPIQPDGTLKSVTVTHEPDGKWYFSILIEYPAEEVELSNGLQKFFASGDINAISGVGLDMSVPFLYITTIRWKLYNEVKVLFPDIDIHITYGAETKERRRAFDITKSHVNDAFVMGQFHPKHRSKPVCYKKKRRNNRCLEKFYDAKYINSRDGKKRTGQELFNGRISRNHKKDSENLHQYRRQKISAGKRAIRKQHYAIQPHDIVIFNGEKFETSGCHNNGTRVILLPQKKSVAIKKLNIYRYAGGYFKSAFNQK